MPLRLAVAARPSVSHFYNAVFYRPELDGLRFFAFLAVFAFHAFVQYTPERFTAYYVPAWMAETMVVMVKGGAYGVDVFFALSAYLITELLLRERAQRGTLDVKAFYVRRMLRIWPLYYFFILVAFAVPFFNPDQEFSFRYLALFLLLAGNWSLVLFGWQVGPVVAPLWSVSIEEQFYLLWPPIVARLSRAQITIAAIVMILVANAVRFWQVASHVSPQHLWGNTFHHLDSIAVGILLCVLMKGRTPEVKNVHRIAMVVSAIACFAIVGHFAGAHLTTPITSLAVLVGYAVIPACCFALLVAFMGLKLQAGWLTYLGKISYGLYVYHMACMYVVRSVPGLNDAILVVPLSLGLNIAVAAVSYQILEKPFLRLKPRFTHIQSGAPSIR